MFGVGFGAFIDGIVLHQILQWHHMLSSRPSTGSDSVEGLEANVLADGVFHLVALVALVGGTVILWLEWRRGRSAAPWGAHLGLVLVGWAAFNLIEGVVNHHVLGIHHVREDVPNMQAWDLGFLALSAVMLVAGLTLWSVTTRRRQPVDVARDRRSCDRDSNRNTSSTAGHRG